VKNKKVEKFLSIYKENYELYERAVELLKEKFHDNFRGSHIHNIKYRIKDSYSLEKKIRSKGIKYNRLNDITDIIGIRIIVNMEDQIEKVTDLVKKNFIIDEKNSIDKSELLDLRSFGYRSHHYVCEFPEREEYDEFRGMKFEIQIRTTLQHAWAEIEHDLGYKSRVGIPNELVRSFSRVAGLLELADKEFVEIKKHLRNYEGNIKDIIKHKRALPSGIPINKISLAYYLKNDKEYEVFAYDIASSCNATLKVESNDPTEEYIRRLEYVNIVEIGDLREELYENNNLIEFMTRKLLDETGEKMFTKGAIFYSIAYAKLATRTYGDKLKFFELFQILNPEEKKEMAESLEAYYVEFDKEYRSRYNFPKKK